MLKIIFCLFLLSCASNKPLVDRGMSKEQRILYINKHSDQYPKYIQDAFINKDVTLGFDKRLVIGLFGKPNTFFGDSLWWYTDSTGDGILKIEFKNGLVSSMSY